MKRCVTEGILHGVYVVTARSGEKRNGDVLKEDMTPFLFKWEDFF